MIARLNRMAMGDARRRVADVLERFAARGLVVGHSQTLGPALGALAWLVGLLVVFVPLAAVRFRRA